MYSRSQTSFLAYRIQTDSVTYHPLISRQTRQLRNSYTDVFVGPLERECSHGQYGGEATAGEGRDEIRTEWRALLCVFAPRLIRVVQLTKKLTF
jgi:hypothetical protein